LPKRNKGLNLAVLKRMKLLSYLLAAILLLSLGLFACKSQKSSTDNSKDKVSYNTRKAYNQYYYQGAKLKALGAYDDAVKEFEKALGLIPDSHESFYQLGNIYFKLNRLEEAIHYAELAIKKNPEFNFWYHGQLAQMYSKARQYDKSAAVFAEMVEKEPGRKSNYEEAGNQYINANKPKEAIKYYEKSLSKFGEEENVSRKLEQIYFELNQPKEAVRVIKKLSDTYPSEIKFLSLLAETQLKANDVSEAKVTYLKILAMDENNGFACFGMADLLKRENKYDESFSYLSKGFADKRVSSQHKLKVITSYYFLIIKDQKSKEQAFELADKLIKAHPDESTSYQVYSDMLLVTEDYAKSRIYLKIALAFDGKDYRIWQKLFGIDIKLANNQFLFEDSKAGLELFTTQPGLYIIHSEAALRVSEYDIAIQKATEGLDIAFKPEEKTQLNLTIAEAWYEKGNYVKSDSYFEKVLEYDQQNSTALNSYAYKLYKRNTQLDKAQEMILKALAMEPNNGAYADTYGCILMAQGKLVEAETWIKKSLVLDGDDPEVLEHLGDLYKKQGKNDLALETYRKALKKDPNNKSLEKKLLN